MVNQSAQVLVRCVGINMLFVMLIIDSHVAAAAIPRLSGDIPCVLEFCFFHSPVSYRQNAAKSDVHQYSALQ